MEKTYKTLRKVLALVIGLPIFIVGIILIPLPGPGLLICLLGLFILSQEFDWAQKRIHKLKTEFKKIVAKSKAKSDRFR